MATVTGLTAERMQEIADASVVSGAVDLDGDLILTKEGGGLINAGHVVGPEGPEGPAGPAGFTAHRCQLIRNTTQQVLPVDSWQAVVWPSAEHDPYNMHTDGSANIVLPSAGYWSFHFSLVLNIPAAAGRLETAFSFDGTRRSVDRMYIGGSGAGLLSVARSCQAYVAAAGAVIQAHVMQSLQGTGWGIAGSNINRFSAVRISD